jgi:hypothetical protein
MAGERAEAAGQHVDGAEHQQRVQASAVHLDRVEVHVPREQRAEPVRAVEGLGDQVRADPGQQVQVLQHPGRDEPGVEQAVEGRPGCVVVPERLEPGTPAPRRSPSRSADQASSAQIAPPDVPDRPTTV